MLFSTISRRIFYHPKLGLKEYDAGFIFEILFFHLLKHDVFDIKNLGNTKSREQKKMCARPYYPETAALNILVSLPPKLFSEQELCWFVYCLSHKNCSFL